MKLKADHAAGGFFIVVGIVVFALSGDLPVGTLSSPGSGLLPKLVTSLMMLFGLIVLLGAKSSGAFRSLRWAELPHAAKVLAVTCVVISLYTTIGFVASILLLLLGLTVAVERLPLVRAGVFSAAMTGLTYVVFDLVLGVPLPVGSVWY